jgi:hypothetical protein
LTIGMAVEGHQMRAVLADPSSFVPLTLCSSSLA